MRRRNAQADTRRRAAELARRAAQERQARHLVRQARRDAQIAYLTPLAEAGDAAAAEAIGDLEWEVSSEDGWD